MDLRGHCAVDAFVVATLVEQVLSGPTTVRTAGADPDRGAGAGVIEAFSWWVGRSVPTAYCISTTD